MSRSVQTRVTHQYIADQLGVSRVSVTQALHGTRRSTLSPELQARILEAARELNYRPRNVATYAIGFVGDTANWALAGESQFLLEMDHTLREAGYRVLLASVKGDNLKSVRDVLTPKSVDGVIFTRWFDGQIQDLLPPEIPWIVTSDEDGMPDDIDQITLDTKATAYRVARYLQSFGHQRIGLVTGPGDLHYHGHIKAGIRTAMEEAGGDWSHVQVIEVLHDRELKQCFLDTMRKENAPTALIAVSPEKTIAVLNLLCSAGYRVPRDVSVVSMADSRMFEPLTPAITATSAGYKRVQCAAERLLAKIQDPGSKPHRLLMPGEIIERESVAIARRR